MTHSDHVVAMETVSDEKLRTLLEDLEGDTGSISTSVKFLTGVVSELLASRLARQGWQGMESAPKDKTPVIIAVPTKDRDDFIVGEAYFDFDPENHEGGDWWWSGTDWGDYHGGPISEINHHLPEYWQPLPAAPSPVLGEPK